MSAETHAGEGRCWCCGQIRSEGALVRLGSHPEVGICVNCVHYLKRRARDHQATILGRRLRSASASRMLRSLEADGLITVRVSSADARARTVTLTAAGCAERATLDRLSDEADAAILAPLRATQRTRLEAARPR